MLANTAIFITFFLLGCYRIRLATRLRGIGIASAGLLILLSLASIFFAYLKSWDAGVTFLSLTSGYPVGCLFGIRFFARRGVQSEDAEG